MTEQLADWLLAQLAADEQVARLMADATWPESVHVTADTEAVVNGSVSVAPGTSKRYKRIWDNSIVDDGWVVHESAVEVWSKDVAARVLADIDAKRRIVERAQFVDNHGPAVDHDRAMDMTTGASAALRDVLKLLALPYAGRDGYQKRWRP